MNVQRYEEPVLDGEDMHEDPNGQWVRYEDYAKLLRAYEVERSRADPLANTCHPVTIASCRHEHTSISAGGLTRECNQCGMTGLPLVRFAKADPLDVGQCVLMDGTTYWLREDGNVVCLEGV